MKKGQRIREKKTNRGGKYIRRQDHLIQCQMDDAPKDNIELFDPKDIKIERKTL